MPLIRLGELAGAAVVLGSATPAVESLGRALDGRYDRVVLPTRPTGAVPPMIEVADMRAELAEGNRGLLSWALDEALATLDTARGDQAILVLNRRGTASVVLCRDCGTSRPARTASARWSTTRPGPRCAAITAAAPHRSRPAARTAALPRIRYLGGGTERVEREVREAHPRLRVARLDRDVADRRGAAERVIDAFTAGDVDVLVGTSLVAKGLDVPTSR